MTQTIFFALIFITLPLFSAQADLMEIYRLHNQLKSAYGEIEKLQKVYRSKIQEAINMDKDALRQDLTIKMNDELSKCREQNAAFEVLNKIYAEQIDDLQNKMNASAVELKDKDQQLTEALATVLAYTSIINDQGKEINLLREDVVAKSQIILNMQTKAQNIVDSLHYLQLNETPTEPEVKATSCLAFENSTNVQTIKVDRGDVFSVPCDAQLAGSGGWTVIQRRIDGGVKFYRNWQEYREGFGNLEGEFFIGMDKLHRMTAALPHELYVHLTDFNNESSHAFYDNILIAGEDENYTLKELGEYSGNAGDAMRDNEHQKFSTFDKDNDVSELNCAQTCLGGWWYNNCGLSNLNGQYTRLDDYYDNSEHGIYWDEWQGPGYTLQSVQMMIRPKVDSQK